jgi:hypothetical protein
LGEPPGKLVFHDLLVRKDPWKAEEIKALQPVVEMLIGSPRKSVMYWHARRLKKGFWWQFCKIPSWDCNRVPLTHF